jgi:tRNA (adenine57-N1/adenine58-N1)-methyltransferase
MQKILFCEGKFFYVRDATQDYHCQFGVIRKDDLKKKDGSVVSTNTGKELSLFTPFFSDRFRKLKRVPQLIPLKDVGLIIAETGIGKESVVLDAGTGAGSLSIFLSNIVKKVVTYEIRDDFRKVAEQNLKEMDIKNVALKKGSIYEEIKDKNFDLVTLDVPEPWLAVPNLIRALKPGGYIVAYSPQITQVQSFMKEVIKHKELELIKTSEIMERLWRVEDLIVRPKQQPIVHSGFLTFLRKVRA